MCTYVHVYFCVHFCNTFVFAPIFPWYNGTSTHVHKRPISLKYCMYIYIYIYIYIVYMTSLEKITLLQHDTQTDSTDIMHMTSLG